MGSMYKSVTGYKNVAGYEDLKGCYLKGSEKCLKHELKHKNTNKSRK